MKKVFALIIGILFIASLFGAAVWYYDLERFEQTYEGDLITFSLTEMYYDTAQQLELAAVSELRPFTKIFYTLDGAEPTQDSTEYTKPIALETIKERGCHIIRAALFQDGVRSAHVYTRSYFIGIQPALHEDTYVVSLAGDPDDFYGELGIFSGPVTSPFITEEPEDANYLKHGKEWERPVNMQVFDPLGDTVLSQNAGVRISGNYSRYAAVKSLKLFARREYDPKHGMFEAPFLTQGETAGGSGLPIEKVNRIELRNGGNDFVATMLGDAYSRRLAQMCDIAIVGQPTPAAVYLNGIFYGFMWMQPNDDEKTVAEFAGISNSDNVKIVDGSEELVTGTDDAIVEEYNRLKEFIYILDYDNQGARDAIEALVDIDNLFMYYIFQMHMGNTDWPMKNFKVWKYTGTPDPDNPNTDGRWRFLLYDIDYAFGTFQNDFSFGLDTFDWIFISERSQFLLSLLQSEVYRNRFINIWCDMMADTLTSERAMALLEHTIAQSQDELAWREEMYPETRPKEEIAWEDTLYPSRFRTQNRLDGYDLARTFMQNRETYVHENLQNFLHVSVPFELDMQVPDCAMVTANGVVEFEPGQNTSSTYYADCAPYFEAIPADGYKLVGWDVNGQRYGQTVLVLDADMVAGAETVVATPIVEKIDEAQPVMCAISYYDNEDWVEIYNPGLDTISLEGYYLSDKAENSKRYILPAIELKHGESIVFYGSDNIYAPLGAYQFGFNLSQYETVTLIGPEYMPAAVGLPNSRYGYIYERDRFGRWKYTAGTDYQ